MLDCETFGIDVGCVVLNFGMIVFDPEAVVDYTQTPIERMQHILHSADYPKLEVSFSLIESLALGLTVDQATAKFWQKRTSVGRPILMSAVAESVSIARQLQTIQDFCTPYLTADSSLWASGGKTFDFLHLKHLIKLTGQKVWWEFWQEQDERTVRRMFNAKIDVPEEYKHGSLNDCAKQILVVQNCYQQIAVLKELQKHAIPAKDVSAYTLSTISTLPTTMGESKT